MHTFCTKCFPLGLTFTYRMCVCRITAEMLSFHADSPQFPFFVQQKKQIMF